MSRSAPPLRRLAVLAALVIPAPLVAQTVAGVVVDSASGRPIAGVTIMLRSARDSVFVRGSVTDDAGRFTIPLVRPDTLLITARRIGLRSVNTPPEPVLDKVTRRFRFEMTPIVTQLDTVRAGVKRVIRGFGYELTAGQEWFAQHAWAGKGFFTSGIEMRLSGRTACDFFSELPGFESAHVVRQGITGIGCYWNRLGPTRYIVPTNQTECLDAFVDGKHRLIGVDSAHIVAATGVSETPMWLRIDRIRGIELFAKYEDRPKDFSVRAADSVSLMSGMASRTGMRTLGSTAAQTPVASPKRGGGNQQRCALLLIWTEKFWG